MRLEVLDNGYVRLIEFMGGDMSVVNAARVSFDREINELNEGDERLLKFLLKNGHTSPFRHAFMSFEIYAPLMVARQWWKYVVGSDHTMDAWNESSRRYVTEEPVFYVPNKFEWRSSPENMKQGSGEPVPHHIGAGTTRDLMEYIERGVKLYEQAMAEGICAEQARLFLPANGMYVRWRWSASLQSVLHFLEQRLAHDAQAEITEYASAVQCMMEIYFPKVGKAIKEVL